MDGRNYLRNTILALEKLNKPFILQGQYCSHLNCNYITYIKIRPYMYNGASTNKICDHLNVLYPDVKKYIGVNYDYDGIDVFVCRAKTYRDSEGILRGGIYLTEELGIPPVMERKFAKRYVRRLDKSKYVDFLKFAEGRYAYFGENLWKHGHKKREVKEEVKIRKKPNVVDFSVDVFMEMHKEKNPLWIPPPISLKYKNERKWLYMAVPQRSLRKILDKSPSLRRKVVDELSKKI